MLGEGKAFMNEEGKFVSGTNEISDVKVTDAPFLIENQPQGKVVPEGMTGEKLSVGLIMNEKYSADEVTYKWYECEKEYKLGLDIEFTRGESVGEEVELVLPEGLSAGEQKIYQCEVSCNGYVLYTDRATVTFGKGKPILKVYSDESYSMYTTVNGYGNDCVLVFASYTGLI